MATLAALGDNARRKMNLGLGEHTVTITYASVADGDTVTVHGIILTCITGSAAVELAQFKKETNATATGDNLEDLIDAIFDSTTGVSAASSAGVVTITGAKSVTTDNATGFAISSSSYQDEPPYTSDFDQWILDGQLDVAGKVVNEGLIAGDSGLSEEFDLTGLGSFTVTLASVVEDDTVTVDGIVMTAKDAATTEVADFITTGTDNQDAQNLDDLIGAIFGSTTSVTVSVAANVVTIAGAKTVVSSNATRLAVATVSDGSATRIAIPTNLFRPIEVRAKIGSDSDLYWLQKVDVDDMIRIREGTHPLYEVNSADKARKYWSDYNDYIQFSAAPVSGAAMAKIIGIKTPQTTKTTNCELPSHLQPFVEDYAVVQAYRQKQRLDLSEPLFQAYLGNLKIVNERYQQTQEDLK